MATSGDYEQFFQHNGKKYSHLIDPRTLRPVDNEIISVTVVAHNLTTADALATALFVMGPQKANQFLRKTYSNMTVYMLEKTPQGEKMHIY